jgi:hypothetical protein
MADHQHQPAPSVVLPGLTKDVEDLIFGLLHPADVKSLRLVSRAARLHAGALVRRLLLVEDGSSGGVLPSVDLAASYPALESITIRCAHGRREGWDERFAAFVQRNQQQALAPLGHLDLSDCGNVGLRALTSIALLPSLKDLSMHFHKHDAHVVALVASALTQLTRLNVGYLALDAPALASIAQAAPQLQDIGTVRLDDSPASMEALQLAASRLQASNRLRRLVLVDICSGSPGIMRQALASLRGLASLAHLELPTSNDYGASTPGIIQELGWLTNLESLKLGDFSMCPPNLAPAQLAPLANLVHLTRLDLVDDSSDLTAEQGLVLAQLPSLLELRAGFAGAAAAVAAVRPLQEQLQLIDIRLGDARDVAEGLVQPRGELRVPGEFELYVFDLSQVRVLDLYLCRGWPQRLLAPALAVCSQLLSLRIRCEDDHEDGEDELTALSTREVVDAISGLQQLQHLCLSRFEVQPTCALAKLAVRCTQLRQLTVYAVNVSEDVVGMFISMPSMRVLRLLVCESAPSREACQRLVQPLAAYDVRVDVVDEEQGARGRALVEKYEAEWKDA